MMSRALIVRQLLGMLFVSLLVSALPISGLPASASTAQNPPDPFGALTSAQTERSRAHDDLRRAQAEWIAGESSWGVVDSTRRRERLDTQRRLRKELEARKRSFNIALVREFEVLAGMLGSTSPAFPAERLQRTLSGFEGLFLDLKTNLEIELLALGVRERWLQRETVDADFDALDSATIVVRELRNDFERISSGSSLSLEAMAAGCTKAGDIIRQIQSRLASSPWDNFYDALDAAPVSSKTLPRPMRLIRPAEAGLLSAESSSDNRAILTVRTGSAFVGIWEAGFGTDNFYRVELRRSQRGILSGTYEAVVKSEDRRNTFNFQLTLEEDRSSTKPDELNAAWSDMNSKARGRVMLRVRNGQMSIQGLESPKGFRPNVFDPSKLLSRR